MLITPREIDSPKDILPDIYQLVLWWKSKSSNQLQNSDRVINTLQLVPSSLFFMEVICHNLSLHPAPRFFNSQRVAQWHPQFTARSQPDTICEPSFSPFITALRERRETQTTLLPQVCPDVPKSLGLLEGTFTLLWATERMRGLEFTFCS